MHVSNSKVTYLDLFAGAGGLSEGFVSAGYQPIAHVEMDADACNTLKTRECFYFLKSIGQEYKYYEYLRKNISREQLYKMVPDGILDSVICETMSEESMPSIFEKIDSSLKVRDAEKIKLIIGGPPCQAYSNVGRARTNMDKDPRNTLYELYFQAIEKYTPEMFVFENVPGLLTAGKGKYLREIMIGFRSRGYDLDYEILNAADFGVLQNRRRIILIGWKKETPYHYPKFVKEEQGFQVVNIFDDLPALEPGEVNNQYAKQIINQYLQISGIRSPNDVLTWHIARTNLDRDREIYRLAIRLWEVEHKRLKYTDIPSELVTHTNTTSFLDRFKVVAADLPATHTMVAHISKDGHYYIHPDIKQARSISVREAARIQSFPDNYFFEGSRTSAFKQIGNAVPPLMANRIADALLEQLRGNKNGQ